MLLDFYMVHYNIGIAIILLIVAAGFLIAKQNYKLMLAILAVLLVLNIFIYKKTADKTWTREFYSTDEIENYPVWDKFDKEKRVVSLSDTTKITFAIKNPNYPWVSYSETGDTLRHWCWLDEAWEQFSETDLVAFIWNEPANKKIRGSTESRIDDANNLN